MKRMLLVMMATLSSVGCGETPTETVDPEAPIGSSVVGAIDPVGAIVLNRGEATEPFFGTCQFNGRVTNDVTILATADGGAIFKCHWDDYPAPDYGRAVVIRGWTCDLSFPPAGFFGVTNQTSFVLSRSHRATVTCVFKEAPTGRNQS